MNGKLEAPTAVACAQCGRGAAADEELSSWRPRSLVGSGELDELTAPMLLCPECAEEDLLGEYEAGEVD